MAQTTPVRGRVGGSGLTAYVWNFRGADGGIGLISFARQVSHVSPAPVGPGTVPIHPLDLARPAHLVTAQAVSMGTLTLELYELVDRPAWQRLPGLSRTNDLADVFSVVASAEDFSISKYVYHPKDHGVQQLGFVSGSQGTGKATRSETYHGCVVSQLMDGETIETGTMEVLKQLVINYAYVSHNNSDSTTPGAQSAP